MVNSTEVRFEQVKPVRTFSSYKRQRHFPGLWWSSMTGRHAGYESGLERDHLMLLRRGWRDHWPGTQHVR
ncbi:MAG TPA: hypothetical protein VFX61_16650 [Micromonosporaceae bacterium]|nr:hypothetical protein [Micromonosporaceae bacterium]